MAVDFEGVMGKGLDRGTVAASSGGVKTDLRRRHATPTSSVTACINLPFLFLLFKRPLFDASRMLAMTDFDFAQLNRKSNWSQH